MHALAWPDTPQEVHEHLNAIAPALMKGAHPAIEPGPVLWDDHIYVEYWSKEDVEEGLWVFARADRGRIDREEIEAEVLFRVAWDELDDAFKSD